MENKQLKKDVDKIQECYKKAKDTLQKAGYYINTLYHIEDVQWIYECTDEQAMEILELAMDNDGTANQVIEEIKYHAEEMGLKHIEE